MTSKAAVAGRASGADIHRLVRLAAAPEVLPWRSTERATEHGCEGASAAVAETVRDARHRIALGKPADRLGETHLPTPLREAHAGLALGEPRQRAGAGADAL